jgi:hypothetical protein
MNDDRHVHDSDAVERAARIIAEALREAEVILAGERQARGDAAAAEALGRFGDVLTRLVEHTERLAARMAELTEAVALLVEGQRAGATETAAPQGFAPKPQLPEMEPSFAPGGEGIDVTIAAVPGFQGLMELQRALVRLPQVQSAAVRRYQDDEAVIQLVLSQPMTASAIAEGVSAATERTLVVDDARPDMLRLRLRFLG